MAEIDDVLEAGNAMHPLRYAYDFEKCECYGRRIGVQLSRGSITGARESLEHAWDELTDRERIQVGHIPISTILPLRDANTLDTDLSAIFICDLIDVDESDLLGIPNVGRVTVDELRSSLKKLGLPFPFTHQYQSTLDRLVDLDAPYLPEPTEPTEKERTMTQTTPATTLVDAIDKASPSDLAEIENKIEALRTEIRRLEKAKRLLTTLLEKDSPPTKPGEVGRQVLNWLQENGGGGSLSKCAEELGFSKHRVASAVTKMKRVSRQDDTINLIKL